MAPSRPVSILLVDDQPRNALAVAGVLARVDCTVVTAQSGREALKHLLREDFAVILLDVQIVGLDAFETAGLIRARARSRSTPIIFMTANDRRDQQRLAGYELGAIDFLYKPFSAQILRSKVTFFVEMFRQTKALEWQTSELSRVAADLVYREQQVVALNAELQGRVLEGTTALDVAISDLDAESAERVRAEERLRELKRTGRAEADIAAGRASALAEVSRVLVEDFMDHRPMLARVAHIAALATDAACLIQLGADHPDERALRSLAVDHPDGRVRDELMRILSSPGLPPDTPWQVLDTDFLAAHPLIDVVSVPMLARTAKIGVLSLARFGPDAPHFTISDRKFSADLTARVALAVENARLYEGATAAIETRDTFLNIAAHELKTPLTTIQGYSQLLSHQMAEGVALDAVQVRRSARIIEDRTRHLARTIEQILDVSRLVAARMHLAPGETDLVRMIRDLAAAFDSRHELHTFRLHFAEDGLQAMVDRLRLEQVLANLIDNAVRYSPDGGVIDITLERTLDEFVVLSVRDHGLGIAAEHRPRLFEQFHQAHAAEARSGMGLGLYISREIVALHGGQLAVMFPEDGGAEFTIRLPRAMPPAYAANNRLALERAS